MAESINEKMNTYAKKMAGRIKPFLLLGFHESEFPEYICKEVAVTVEGLRARLAELGILLPPEDFLALLAPARELRRRADELSRGDKQ